MHTYIFSHAHIRMHTHCLQVRGDILLALKKTDAGGGSSPSSKAAEAVPPVKETRLRQRAVKRIDNSWVGGLSPRAAYWSLLERKNGRMEGK